MEMIDTALFADASLKGYWRLENSLADSSSSGYTLTDSSSSNLATAKYGQGRSFVRASSQFAYISDASCPNLEIATSHSMLAWAKFTTHSNGSYPVAKAKSDASVAHGIRSDVAGTITAVITGLTPDNLASDATITDGVWYLIGYIYNSTTNKLSVVVNTTIKEVSVTGSPTDTNGDFAIGRLGGNNSSYFDGSLDDVMVFSKALTQQEVNALYEDFGGSFLLNLI